MLNVDARRIRPWTVYPFSSSSSARYEPSWPVIPVITAVRPCVGEPFAACWLVWGLRVPASPSASTPLAAAPLVISAIGSFLVPVGPPPWGPGRGQG